MKKNQFLIWIILVLFGCYIMNLPVVADDVATKEAEQVRAKKYKMTVRLNTKKNSLSEKVQVDIVNHTSNKVQVICFRNMAESVLRYDKKYYKTKENKKKKSVIQWVKNPKGKKLSIRYKKDASIFYVNLGRKGLKPGESIQMTIKAKTDIPKREDRFGYSEDGKKKMYALSFCFPYLADNGNGSWNFDPYFDDGESRASEVTDYKVKFIAPKNYVVASTGSHQTKNGITKITAKKVRDFAIVASNYLQKESFKVSGITINNYYFPGKNAKKYRKICKLVARDAVSIFTKQIGKCPFQQLDMVACRLEAGFGGMEFPGLLMNNASAYYGDEQAANDPYSLQEVVVHEIAHQWFYAGVGNDEYKEGWLDEGFTTYLEQVLYGLTDSKSMRYVRKLAKEEKTILDFQKEFDEIVQAEHQSNQTNYINIPVRNYSKKMVYGEREYEGGKMFLCELNLVMGKEKFGNFLMEYYKEYLFKKATTSDVLALIRKYDNEKDVNAVIKKYIRSSYLM